MIRHIPLNKLKKSPKNVRTIPHTTPQINALAASIQVHGQIQNLVVETEKDGQGRPTGFYRVTVGEGRRLAQLVRLKRKQIKADEPIACIIDDAHNACAVSLAENDLHHSLHPIDQFMAFKTLADTGQSIADIAAQFSVTPLIVQRRLKLANLAPQFIDLYRKAGISLDLLMALALTDDHAKQREVWNNLSKLDRYPSAIRRALTEREIPASAPIVKFVGLRAYEKAGGLIRRDLFAQTHEEGYVMDADLLRQMALEKLKRVAAPLQAKGYAWVDVIPEPDYATLAEYGRVGAQPRVPVAQQQAVAGAIVTLNPDGTVRIETGVVKPQDAETLANAAKAASAAATPDRPQVHSAALVRRLAAHRTAAVQATLCEQPAIALAVLTHRLVLTTFYDHTAESASALQIKLNKTDLHGYAPDLNASHALATLIAYRQRLSRELPSEREALLTWLLKQPQPALLELLACCVAASVDGVQTKTAAQAIDALAHATQLDMRKWWTPTAQNYFGCLPKAQILDVVRQAVSPQAAVAVQGLKKSLLAQAAEQALAGTDWLPSLFLTYK